MHHDKSFQFATKKAKGFALGEAFASMHFDRYAQDIINIKLLSIYY